MRKIKRKSYAADTTFGFVDGLQIKDAKGITGIGKNMALSTVTSPAFVLTGVAEAAKGKVDDAIAQAGQTAATYTPTVQNIYAGPRSYSNLKQKSYGVIQAIKEAGTGVGKGLWEYAKDNKKNALGIIGIGALLPVSSWAVNRLQRQKEENEAGTRTTDGMSTGGKVAAGATTLGAAGYAGYTGARSWDRSMKGAEDVIKNKVKYVPTGKVIETPWGNVKDYKLEGYDEKLHKEFFHTPKEKDPKTGKEVRKWVSPKKKAREKIAELNKKGLLGLVDGRTSRIIKRAGITGTVIGGSALLANSYLKQNKDKSQKSYSDLEQKEYGLPFNLDLPYKLGKKVGKSAYDKVMKSAGSKATSSDKAAAYITGVSAGLGAGSRRVVRALGDFAMLGHKGARKLARNLDKSLRAQGKYGEATADFLRDHKTSLALGTGALGWVGMDALSSIGDKSVTAATSLDKKTSEYMKRQQEMHDNEYMNNYQ